MREWFNAQTPRDQIALIALAAAVVIYSVVAFALVPASEARSQMMANNKAATAQLARVEAKVSQLVDLRANGESGQNQNLSSTQSAAIVPPKTTKKIDTTAGRLRKKIVI